MSEMPGQSIQQVYSALKKVQELESRRPLGAVQLRPFVSGREAQCP